MRTASYDLEAEQAVLGAFLIDEDTWPRIGETFCPDAFFLQAHQAIAAAIIARRARGNPADPLLLRGDLIDSGDRTAAELVLPLAKGVGTAANVRYYWQRLLELQQRREAGHGGALRGLAIGGALAKEEAALEGGTRHVATGWPRLDSALGGGFALPSLNILGAAPKSGKSTWAQIIAEPRRGGRVRLLPRPRERPSAVPAADALPPRSHRRRSGGGGASRPALRRLRVARRG